MNTKFQNALGLFPPRLAYALTEAKKQCCHDIYEIRMRLGRNFTVTDAVGEKELGETGIYFTRERKIRISSSDIETVISRAFRNSVFSYKRELASGYMTCDGGCRVGFCGTAAVNHSEGDRIESVKNISSVNVRISAEITGCADELFSRVYSDGLKGLLIAGAPSSGKTTILRDLTRQLGNIYKVSLIDERGEIAASSDGIPQNDVGSFTDVFDAYGKYQGIMTAVRVMSPKIIVCDEIGSHEDLKALDYAINSGVKLLASCHAESLEDLKNKREIYTLLKSGAFDRCAFLKGCGKIVKISDLRNEKCLSLQGV